MEVPDLIDLSFKSHFSFFILKLGVANWESCSFVKTLLKAHSSFTDTLVTFLTFITPSCTKIVSVKSYHKMATTLVFCPGEAMMYPDTDNKP